MNGNTGLNGRHKSKTGAPATVHPSVSLAFGHGQAWDDSELINAYDAAMSEFHVSGSLTNLNDRPITPVLVHGSTRQRLL